MTNKIIFRPSKPFVKKDYPFSPSTSQSVIPQWYKEADRFAVDPITKQYYKAPKHVCPFPKEGTKDDYGKIPTWKACPAIMDSFSTGYVLKTPTDVEFYKNSLGKISVKIADTNYHDFCMPRTPMPQFEHPKGYYRDHFSWQIDWGIELPEGYSCLYMTPMNRFDLPILNTTGIVDNDKVHLSGSLPFFIVEGWEGIIPAGTPYVQILPFKRENWEHEIEILPAQKMQQMLVENMRKYRKPDGGIYIKEVWSRREYK